MASSVNMGIKRAGELKRGLIETICKCYNNLENLHSQESSFSESHKVHCIYQKKQYPHFLENYVQQKKLFRHQFKLTMVKTQ